MCSSKGGEDSDRVVEEEKRWDEMPKYQCKEKVVICQPQEIVLIATTIPLILSFVPFLLVAQRKNSIPLILSNNDNNNNNVPRICSFIFYVQSNTDVTQVYRHICLSHTHTHHTRLKHKGKWLEAFPISIKGLMLGTTKFVIKDIIILIKNFYKKNIYIKHDHISWK